MLVLGTQRSSSENSPEPLNISASQSHFPLLYSKNLKHSVRCPVYVAGRNVFPLLDGH